MQCGSTWKMVVARTIFVPVMGGPLSALYKSLLLLLAMAEITCPISLTDQDQVPRALKSISNLQQNGLKARWPRRRSDT